jgi:hypothetical protein
MAVALVAATAMAGACHRSVAFTIDTPQPPRSISSLELVGEYEVRPGARVGDVLGLPFGGVSGLVALGDGAELLGISDARQGPRAYRLRVSGVGASFTVSSLEAIYFDAIPGRIRDLDAEAIAILPNGDLLVATEGVANRAPRQPPGLIEYGRYGEFVRSLEIRDRFVPEENGEQTRGVRANMSFESVTVAPDGRRLFAGVESALVQDGPAATFEHGATVRLLEYDLHGASYRPGPEFAYDIEPIAKPDFESSLAINGLVELVALSSHELLALERGYVEEAGRAGRSMNRIRIFLVSLEGATDISRIESLASAQGVTRARKRLLLDLSDVKGLRPALATLENFEGMTLGPRLPDGRRSLVLVSDDNFSARQRTSFLIFAIR